MYQGIFEAVKERDLDRLKEQLNKVDKSDLSVIVNDLKQTPLMVATLNNDLNLVSYLLDFGFDPSQKDVNELPPFVASAANGYGSIFKLMTYYKPDKGQYNRFGGTALIPSSEKGYLETMQLALDYGVPVDHQNKLGWSALLEAVILGDGGYLFRDIIRELLEHGADIHIKDFDGKSSLDYARMKHQEHVIEMMNKRQDDEYSTVRTLIRNKDYSQALYKLQVKEESLENTYYLGLVFERLKDYKTAEYYYKQGLKQDIQFAFYLAQLYRKQDKLDLALAMFNQDQDLDYLQYHKSNFLRDTNRHEEAVDVMDSLLAKDPKRVDYMFHKANSLRTLGKHEEAYKVMIRASEVMPQNDLFEKHAKQSMTLMEKKRGK